MRVDVLRSTDDQDEGIVSRSSILEEIRDIVISSSDDVDLLNEIGHSHVRLIVVIEITGIGQIEENIADRIAGVR